MSTVLSLPAYAAPAVPLAFLGLPLYVYLPAHYAALPGIGLATVGAVLLVARLIDLVTDPLVGLLVDRVRHRMPPQWLIGAGAALMLAGTWWLFRPPGGADALYLFVALGVTYLGWTLLAIPYYVLGAELGAAAGDRHGQTRVAAWREGGAIVGTVAALMVPVVLADGSALGASAGALMWLVPPAVFLVWLLDTSQGGQHNAARAPSLAAIWRGAGRAARQLLAIHLCNAMAGGTAATLFIIYTRDVLGADQRSGGLLLLLYFAAGLLALPLWVALARRVGQVHAWRIAMLVAAAGFAPAALLGDGHIAGFALVCALTGATLGADVALPAAIQARIVEDESTRLARPRGGALFGLWGMAGKLALALAAGLSLPLLALLTGPWGGLDRLVVTPWLYAGLPVLIKLVAVWLLQRSVLLHATAEGGDQTTREVSHAGDSQSTVPLEPVAAHRADDGRV